MNSILAYAFTGHILRYLRANGDIYRMACANEQDAVSFMHVIASEAGRVSSDKLDEMRATQLTTKKAPISSQGVLWNDAAA